MIFLMMAVALFVLLLWSLASTPRVIRHTTPRMWIWWACWLCIAALSSTALLAQGFEEMGWGQ